MLRTIKLDEDRSVEVNTSAGWFFVYKEVFGHDILPDLMPIIEGIFSFLVDAFNDTSAGSVTEIAGNIDGQLINDLFESLAPLEITTVYQILWALAKNADKTIPGLIYWLEEVGDIPLDTALPQVLEAVVDSLASSKNANRLKGFVRDLNPMTSSASTTS